MAMAFRAPAWPRGHSSDLGQWMQVSISMLMCISVMTRALIVVFVSVYVLQQGLPAPAIVASAWRCFLRMLGGLGTS